MQNEQASKRKKSRLEKNNGWENGSPCRDDVYSYLKNQNLVVLDNVSVD